MNNSMRDKWCEKEISDLDYIRHLEAENAKLKEFYCDEYRQDMISYNGYCAGWNSALSDMPKPPHKVYEAIQANRYEPREQQ